jgi:hypothetical protein
MHGRVRIAVFFAACFAFAECRGDDLYPYTRRTNGTNGFSASRIASRYIGRDSGESTRPEEGRDRVSRRPKRYGSAQLNSRGIGLPGYGRDGERPQIPTPPVHLQNTQRQLNSLSPRRW